MRKMVEKVKSTLAQRGWEVLIVALLTVIISGLSYFIVKIVSVQERQEKIVNELGIRQDDIILILVKDNDTDPEDKAVLRQYLMPTRGGGIRLDENSEQ